MQYVLRKILGGWREREVFDNSARPDALSSGRQWRQPSAYGIPNLTGDQHEAQAEHQDARYDFQRWARYHTSSMSGCSALSILDEDSIVFIE